MRDISLVTKYSSPQLTNCCSEIKIENKWASTVGSLAAARISIFVQHGTSWAAELTDTPAFVDCKNRKKTPGCLRHDISDKQARSLKEKTKGCFLLQTEGAFLILGLFLLSKASWLHYFIKNLSCDVGETNVQVRQSEMRTQEFAPNVPTQKKCWFL